MAEYYDISTEPKNVQDHIFRAINSGAERGSMRDKWLMARASYAYSRSFGLKMVESFVGAWEVFRDR